MEMCQKATPGPWEVVNDDLGDEYCVIVPVGIEAGDYAIVDSDGGLASNNQAWDSAVIEADAALIAASRTEMPRLGGLLQRIMAVCANKCSYALEADGTHCAVCPWREIGNPHCEIVKLLREAGVLDA